MDNLRDILLKTIEQEDFRSCSSVPDGFCEVRSCLECKLDRVIARLAFVVSFSPQYKIKNIVEFLDEIVKGK